MNIPDGFAKWPGSNLVVPQTALDERLQKAKQQRELRRAMHGQFFSDWNRLTGLSMSGAVDKPADEPSYSFLRDAYARSAIDQIIVNTRMMQVRRVAKPCKDPHTDIGFKVVHEMHDDPDFEETDDIKHRCRECEELIMHPNPYIHPNGFKDFFVTATEEELVIDRKALIIFRDKAGRPKSYHLVAGDNIKPRLAVLYPWIEKHKSELKKEANIEFEDLSYSPMAATEAMNWASNRASEDRSFNPAGVDLGRAAYVQEIDSKLVAGWTADQMSVNITNPSVVINKLPYGGGSMFQKSLDITAAWVNGWQYNQELFRTNYPENLLMLFGDYDQQGMEAFKRELYGEAGPASWQRLMVVPGDPDFRAEMMKLRDTPRDMMYSELLRFIIMLKTASFRMNPSSVNFSADRGGSSYLFEGNQEDVISLAQEEGFHSILQNMADWLTRVLIKPRYPDLLMVWEGLQKEDEKAKVEITTQKATTYMTIDEARKAENLEPLPNDAGKLPANPTVLQIMQLMNGEQQQGQQPSIEQKQPNEQQEPVKDERTEKSLNSWGRLNLWK